MPVLHYLAELRAGIMVFLWCGLHLTDEERLKDPFESPVLLPCVNIDCNLFREESPFCTHMITVGQRKKCEVSGTTSRSTAVAIRGFFH